MSSESNLDKWTSWQKKLSVLVLALIAVMLIFQLCVYCADILRILMVSILLSYLFINAVDWFNRYIHTRAIAILIVYTFLIVATIIGALVFVPAVTSQVSQLINTTYEQLPQLVESITKTVLPIERRLHAAQIQIKAIDLLNGFVANIPKLEAGMLFNRVSDVAMTTMTGLMYTLGILVVSFYFLLDGYRMKNAIIRLFPKEHEPWLEKMATEIDQSLQAFFHGQIVLGLGFGALMILVYSLLGVHYALLLGVILAVWEIVPVIGPPIGFIPTLIAVAVHGMDNVSVNRFTQLLLVFMVFNGLQWLKDNVVAPRYMGNVIGLHPVVIFLSIMIGAKMDGMLGIIFSLPVACAINVLVSNLRNQKDPEKQLIHAQEEISAMGDCL